MDTKQLCKHSLCTAVGLALLSILFPGLAQTGGTISNGSSSAPPGVVIPSFFFEPEFPLNSLKTVPTWPELEQMLDNPYNAALCSALAGVSPLIQNTPGTTQIFSGTNGSPTPLIFPAYCTTAAVVRRPGFGVTLPPLMVHPLNYNATTGEEMRLLNPNYPQGNWVVPDELLQCGSAEANANPIVRGLCLLRGNNPNFWLWSYKNVSVSPGSPRVGEMEIDNNGPIRADVANNAVASAAFAAAATAGTAAGLATATTLLDATCIATTELFPAPEGSTTCGGDSGEPGGRNALNIPILPTFGLNTASAYSRPAVPGGTQSCTTVNGVFTCTAAPLAGAATGGQLRHVCSTPRGAETFSPAAAPRAV